jgi:hypothetical protein
MPSLEPADAILVLCSHDKKVAERGAQFLEGWAPLLIFSGGLGVITKNIWNEPEADQFAEIAIQLWACRPKDDRESVNQHRRKRSVHRRLWRKNKSTRRSSFWCKAIHGAARLCHLSQNWPKRRARYFTTSVLR